VSSVARIRQTRAATLHNYIEVARFFGLDPYAMLVGAGIRPNELLDP
jgi:hypothetical protein